MRRLSFFPKAFSDFNEWASVDRKTHKKIIDLIEAISRDPFEGIGKPEPLRHELRGYWSRRINDEHRLVYKISDDEIRILSCKYHY